MMWVIRAGRNSRFYDKYLQNSRVYIPWEGYQLNLSAVEDKADFRTVVEKERMTHNLTSVSNWAGQLYTFTNKIQENDLVMIPSKGSRQYCLAKITGSYCYDENEPDKLYHSRPMEILIKDIPRKIFPQSIIYSLGAFRTIFKVRQEDEVIGTIKKWREAHR